MENTHTHTHTELLGYICFVPCVQELEWTYVASKLMEWNNEIVNKMVIS